MTLFDCINYIINLSVSKSKVYDVLFPISREKKSLPVLTISNITIFLEGDKDVKEH